MLITELRSLYFIQFKTFFCLCKVEDLFHRSMSKQIELHMHDRKNYSTRQQIEHPRSLAIYIFSKP